MIEMSLLQAATHLGLNQDGLPLSTRFKGISIDTRTLKPGNLFVAIVGDRLDGHDFLQEAHQKGANAAIVSKPIDNPLPQLIVRDTTLALGRLGAIWRNQFDLPIIAITGSNGKTTLKNMIATIMIAACGKDTQKVLATEGTLNNQWGLPLTLSHLAATHHYAAIEMGMNHFGEIEYLTHLTRPNVAIITNAAAAHLEGVGDVYGVARAKAEIFSGLSPDGIAILNRDDAFYTFWREVIDHRTFFTFGFHPDADVRAILKEPKEASQKQSLTLETPAGHIDLTLSLLGKHNVLNALAATAATLSIGIPLYAIKEGLENLSPAPHRLQLHTLTNGLTLIDDTYNANPFSLQAALTTLASFAGKKILVLGDMKELGNDAKSLHQTAGESIRQAGVDFLFTYGELSENTAKTFGEGAHHFSKQESLLTTLKPFLYDQLRKQPTTILVKGSRSMRMEKVVAELVQPEVTHEH